MLTLLLETIRDWVQTVLANFHSMYLGYVTPQMYGAVGDGVHDDTEAIQQALDRGGVVYFPEGTYLVRNGLTNGNDCLIVKEPNTYLFGEGRKSVIKISSEVNTACSVLRVGTTLKGYENVRDNFTLEGLTFQGSEVYGQAEGGIKLLDIAFTDNVVVHDCFFLNNMYAAITMHGCNNISFDNIRIEACDCGIVQQTYPCSDVSITNCYITGRSSINSFVNYMSEPIGTMCGGDEAEMQDTRAHGRCKRWNINNVVIEHKGTNAISISGLGSTASYPDGRVIAEDWTISNIILRDVEGGVKISNSSRISIDNVTYNKRDADTSSGAVLLNTLSIQYSSDITVRNVTSKETLAWQMLVKNSRNCNIENAEFSDVFKRESEQSLVGTVIQNVENCSFKNIVVNPQDEDFRVQLDSVTNSYIDFSLSPNAIRTLSLVINNGNIGNTIVQRQVPNKSAIKINRATASSSNVDSNNFVTKGIIEVNSNILSGTNQFQMPNRVNIVYTSDTGVANDRTSTKNLFLTTDGFEMILNFNITAGMSAKTTWFASGGNIIPLNDDRLPLSTIDDYTIVCKFKQNGNKWVEIQRLKKYANGRIEDISRPELVTRSEMEQYIQETDTIPTASADYVGKSYLYTGTTTSTYQKGGIYECQQTLTDTYEWKLVNVPVAVVKDIVANSADYAAFQSNIALL